MNKLTMRVIARTDKKTGEEYYEGTVQMPGLKATKLAKNDGCTRYSTRSQVNQAGKRVAEKYCLCYEPVEETVRQAAKKSVKKAPCCTGETCNWA